MIGGARHIVEPGGPASHPREGNASGGRGRKAGGARIIGEVADEIAAHGCGPSGCEGCIDRVVDLRQAAHSFAHQIAVVDGQNDVVVPLGA